MSSQKFPRKKYETPMHPWKETRIKSERELIKKYGLKNHKEVWKAKTYLGKHREQARELLAKVGMSNPQIKKESDQLLLHLTHMGIVSMGASLDDVLALDTESVLSRRLQTLVYLKGFSSTPIPSTSVDFPWSCGGERQESHHPKFHGRERRRKSDPVHDSISIK